jgi:hypothetical protein
MSDPDNAGIVYGDLQPKVFPYAQDPSGNPTPILDYAHTTDTSGAFSNVAQALIVYSFDHKANIQQTDWELNNGNYNDQIIAATAATSDQTVTIGNIANLSGILISAFISVISGTGFYIQVFNRINQPAGTNQEILVFESNVFTATGNYICRIQPGAPNIPNISVDAQITPTFTVVANHTDGAALTYQINMSVLQ